MKTSEKLLKEFKKTSLKANALYLDADKIKMKLLDEARKPKTLKSGQKVAFFDKHERLHFGEYSSVKVDTGYGFACRVHVTEYSSVLGIHEMTYLVNFEDLIPINLNIE
jgi:hypothetical protein